MNDTKRNRPVQFIKGWAIVDKFGLPVRTNPTTRLQIYESYEHAEKHSVAGERVLKVTISVYDNQHD